MGQRGIPVSALAHRAVHRSISRDGRLGSGAIRSMQGSIAMPWQPCLPQGRAVSRLSLNGLNGGAHGTNWFTDRRAQYRLSHDAGSCIHWPECISMCAGPPTARPRSVIRPFTGGPRTICCRQGGYTVPDFLRRRPCGVTIASEPRANVNGMPCFGGAGRLGQLARTKPTAGSSRRAGQLVTVTAFED